MSKKRKIVSAVIFLVLIAVLLAGIFILGPGERHETIGETMKDAVLHESMRVRFPVLGAVNPGLVAAFTVSCILILFAVIVRIFVIPKFTMVPGRFQMLLEEAVGMFDKLARGNSPHRNSFLGAYVFAAGAYIFVGTLFELFGFQVMCTGGAPVSLPAPLSDINGAIMMGVLSYLVILSGGIASNGAKGIGKTLQEFSLPISMSFRLFGALLSGALVTELVYYYMALSFVLPVIVGVLFTLLHALIQAYVLTMLTTLFYGEVSEQTEAKDRKYTKRKKKTLEVE